VAGEAGEEVKGCSMANGWRGNRQVDVYPHEDDPYLVCRCESRLDYLNEKEQSMKFMVCQLWVDENECIRACRKFVDKYAHYVIRK
jgi:hypothetical protein